MSMGLSMLATVLGLLLAAGFLDAAPYQELEPRAGYVPVYIREGETPLSEINLKLAEAFNEVSYESLPSNEDNSDTLVMSTDDINSSKTSDQLMAEDQVVEEIQMQPTEKASQDSKKSVEKANEPNKKVSEAANEAIKELIDVFETEMLERLGLVDAEKPKTGDKISEQPQLTNENQKTLNDDESKLKKLAEPSEKPSDVLTIEAFKAKDFNKESIKDEELDIPDEVSSDQ